MIFYSEIKEHDKTIKSYFDGAKFHLMIKSGPLLHTFGFTDMNEEELANDPTFERLKPTLEKLRP